jgi:hypothetical protein
LRAGYIWHTGNCAPDQENQFTLDVRVITHSHPGSDHTGVKYAWSNNIATEEKSPSLLLPHRAFAIKKVIKFNKEILKDFTENHMEGPNTYPMLDKAKCLMHNHTIKAWEDKVRARGSNLKRLQKKHDRLTRDLQKLPLT